jgi:hypothetical protein
MNSFNYKVAGLSDLEHSLISIKLRAIDALRCANGGAAGYEPSVSGWLRLPEPIENSSRGASLRTGRAAGPQADREVAGEDCRTLPLSPYKSKISGLSDIGRDLNSIHLLVISALRCANGGVAGYEPIENEWFRLPEPIESTSRVVSLRTDERADPRADREVAAEDCITTQTTTDPLHMVLVSTPADLNDPPRDIEEEPEDIDDCRRFRKAAIIDYKLRRRHLNMPRITDLDIAREAGWNDRTPISRFKSCDPRNTLGDNNKIWRVLRSKHSPPFSTCAPKKFPQSRK